MSVDPSSTWPALRLVGSTRPLTAPLPRRPVTPAPATPRPDDRIDFESIYRANLPRLHWPQAFYRLERIRAQLVAATVNSPIRFDPDLPANSPANPYAPAYLKLQPSPAAVNQSATAAQLHQG